MAAASTAATATTGAATRTAIFLVLDVVDDGGTAVAAIQ